MRALLDAGANVSRHPDALPLAYKHDKPASVQLLLQAGADVDATIEWRLDEHRALEAAALYASVRTVELLPHCQHQVDDALRRAIEFSREDMADPPNDHGANRRTLVSLLLEAGADPNALDRAARVKDIWLLERLRQGGADANRPTADGRRPLSIAAAAGALAAVRVLLAAGADPLARDEDDRRGTGYGWVFPSSRSESSCPMTSGSVGTLKKTARA